MSPDRMALAVLGLLLSTLMAFVLALVVQVVFLVAVLRHPDAIPWGRWLAGTVLTLGLSGLFSPVGVCSGWRSCGSGTRRADPV